MNQYEDNLYVGQKIGDKLEITVLTKSTVQMLCDCGNVLSRKRGSILPRSCKDCNKEAFTNTHSNTGISVRKLSTSEADMIKSFKSKM